MPLLPHQPRLSCQECLSALSMFYDLNVPYTTDHVSLQNTLSFLHTLGYRTIALSQTLPSPDSTPPPIPLPLPFPVPSTLAVVTRLTISLPSPASPPARLLQAHQKTHSVLAVRPFPDEKSLSHACLTLDTELISLDLSIRYPFYFRHSTLLAAVARGVRFEICYAQAIEGGGEQRRTVLSNIVQLVRATRGGKGLVVSSGASSALACRAPVDVMNLAVMWGMGRERGAEGVGRGCTAVLKGAGEKREGWRGAVRIVQVGNGKGEGDGDGGKGKIGGKVKEKENAKGKRKADEVVNEKEAEEEKPISKREMKRRAKKARMERIENLGENDDVLRREQKKG